MTRRGGEGDPSPQAPAGLAGKWTMAIKWRTAARFWRSKSGAVSAKAIIYDDPTGFGMEVHSLGSDSTTKIARWSAEAPGSPVLHYVYEVVPKANGPQGDHAYQGAAILHYYPDADELRGNYWTSRMTVGQFELRRQLQGQSVDSGAADAKSERKDMKMRWIGAVITVALVAGVLWFLLGPHGGDGGIDERLPWERQIEFAVEQASKTCLMNLAEHEQRSIETGVRKKMEQYGAGGYTSTERTRKSVNEAFSEAGQIEQDQRLRDCMATQTDKFLAVAKTDPSLSQASPASEGKSGAGTPTTAGAATGPAAGYIYYEEDGGKLTEDGVFGPLNGPAPSYGTLKPNQVLKSVRAAQLREGPSGKAPLIRMLDAGQCVLIVAEPKWAQPGLTKATSGGRLSVRAVSCGSGG